MEYPALEKKPIPISCLRVRLKASDRIHRSSVCRYMVRCITRCIARCTTHTYDILLKARHEEDNEKRKELVCNTILVFIIGLLLMLDILTLYTLHIQGLAYRGISPWLMLGTTSSFVCLLYLSRKGFTSIVSHLLITVLTGLCFYAQLSWGFDLPSVILMWCFIITASSILISTRYAFILSICISMSSLILLELEFQHIHTPVRLWKLDTFMMDDAIEYSIILILIAGISWLSNREIVRSFVKVKYSEQLLREERDGLEIKVRERTDELRTLHIEKINDMYKFVEFGRISSGLFHDLVGPLNTLCLSMDNVQVEKELVTVRDQLKHAMNVSRNITEFIAHAKRQIQKDSVPVKFVVHTEIQNVIKLLDSKFKKNKVEVYFNPSKNMSLLGSQTIFTHIITNLISNAIDSYTDGQNIVVNTRRLVAIYVGHKKNLIEITVRDFGSGIPEEIQNHIFDPFFTTKSEQGCGVGLSATKYSLEKYFNGTISFKPSADKGTCFTVRIPKTRHQIYTNENTHFHPQQISTTSNILDKEKTISGTIGNTEC